MRDIAFRLAQKDDFSRLAHWVIDLSQKPEQHCLHSWASDDADALSRQISKYLGDAELVYVLASRDDELLGAMGCEFDQELGRGWLHGPHAAGDDWEEMATALFTRVLEPLPDSITELDAYLNVKNVRARQFYKDQGFEQRAWRAPTI